MSSDSGLGRVQQKCRTIASDWRSQDFRWKLFQRILNTLMKLSPGEDLEKAKRVATDFEDKCFCTSSSKEEYLSKIQRKLTDLLKSQKSAAVDGNKGNLLPVQGLGVREEVEEIPSVNLPIEQPHQRQHQPPIPVGNSHLLSPKFPKEQASDIMQANVMRSHLKSIQRPVQPKVNKEVNQQSTSGIQHLHKLLQGHGNIPLDLKHRSHQQSLQCLSQGVKVKSEPNEHPYVQSLSKPLMHPRSQSQSFNLQMQRCSNSLQSARQPQKQPTPTEKVHLEASSSQGVLSTCNATPLRADEEDKVYQKEEYVSKFQRKLTDMLNPQKSAAVDGNKNNFLPVQGPSVKKEEVEEKHSVNLSIKQQLRKQHQPPIPVVNSHLISSKFPKEQASDVMQANAVRSHSKSVQKPVQSKVNKQVNQHGTCGMQHQSRLLQGHQNIPVDLKHQNQSHQQSLQCLSRAVEVKSEPNEHSYVQSLSKSLMHPQSQPQSSNLQMQRYSDSLQIGTLSQKQPIPTEKVHVEASSSQVVLSTSNATPLRADEEDTVYQKGFQFSQHQHSTPGMQHQSKFLQGHQNIPLDSKQQNQRHQQSLQSQPHQVKVKSEQNEHPNVQSSPKPLMNPQRKSQFSNLQMQRHSDSLQSITQPQKQPTPTKNFPLEASSSQVVLSTNNVTPLVGDEAEEVYQKIQSFRPYLPELQAFFYWIVRSLQEMASSFTEKQHSKYERQKRMMNTLQNIIKCSTVSKDRIYPGLKEKLPEFDANIPKIIAIWRKLNDMSDQNIKPNVQGESTSMDSNSSIIQALQLPVEKLNNSPIASQFSSNLSPQKDQSNAEIPSPFTSSPSPANGLNNSQTVLHNQSSASFTPGMHQSPLLDESTVSETSLNYAAVARVDEISEKEPPMEKLKKLIMSLSADKLSSAVTDIQGAVSLTDRMHSCNPNYMVGKIKAGSKCKIGEDLSLSARCHMQSETLMPQYMVRKRKINRDITAVSHVHDGSDLRNYAISTFEGQTNVSSSAKRQKCELNRSLQEEILKINQKLFNTEVEIEENVADYGNVWLSAVGEGTFIKCSFTPITYSSDMKLLLSSSECQIKPLSLLIPSSYPSSSPILLNQLTDAELHKDNLNGEIQSRVERSIHTIARKASLEEIVSAWNSIVHDVIIESLGGCTFTSYFGSWQSTLSD